MSKKPRKNLLKKKVWVAVLGSGGIVESVRVSHTEQHAMNAITEHLKGSGYDGVLV